MPNVNTNEPIDECALDCCQAPIYFGQQVWMNFDGGDAYFCLAHLLQDIGVKKISAGEK